MSENTIAPLTIANLAMLERQLKGEKKLKRQLSRRMSQKRLSREQSSLNRSEKEDRVLDGGRSRQGSEGTT